MSKNTKIADLINYISVDGSGNVVLTTGGQVATQSYVTTAVANLVNSAPTALDTLSELATALNNDASFATTVTNSIATKLPLSGGTLTGALNGTSATFSSSVTAGGKIYTSASVADNIVEVINSDTTNGYGLYVRGGGTAANRYVARFKNGADNDVMWVGTSNVGIGLNNPDAKLFVKGSSGAQLLIDYQATNTNYYDADTHIFRSYASATYPTRLTISSTGAATFSSSVTTPLLYTDGATANPSVIMTNTGGNRYELYPDASAFRIYNRTAGTYPFSILNGGNVGIGNTNPNAILSTTATSNGVSIELRARSSDDTYSQINFTNNAGSNVNVLMGAERSGTNGGNMYFYTKPDGSGIQERMRITSGGQLGVGVSSVSNWDSVLRVIEVGQYGNFYAGFNGGYALYMGSGAYYNSGWKYSTTGGNRPFLVDMGDGTFSFKNAATGTANSALTFTTRLTITSGGKVMVNTTDAGPNAYLFASANMNQPYPLGAKAEDSSQGLVGFFNNANSVIGSIHCSGSSVSYNTSSDYRLKEDLKDFNGIEILSNIKVYDFKWKDSQSRMNGVIAHELQEVIPYAVNGQKDELEKDGSIKAQGVDYSKIVPILVKAIQELKAENDELRAILNRNNII